MCKSVCLSVRTHIAVTAGSNFLIIGMMMPGYGLSMMPVIFFFIWPGIPDALTKLSVSKQDSHVMTIRVHCDENLY